MLDKSAKHERGQAESKVRKPLFRCSNCRKMKSLHHIGLCGKKRKTLDS